MARHRRYFLAQDSASHWYLVEAHKRAEWEAWANLPDEDEAGWACPEYAERLNGAPSRVTFRRSGLSGMKLRLAEDLALPVRRRDPGSPPRVNGGAGAGRFFRRRGTADFIQAVHRVQRFLQDRPVRIDLIYTEAERPIRESLEAKWARYGEQTAAMATLSAAKAAQESH